MDELDRAKIKRRQELDNNLEEAFKEGRREFIDQDSLMRPSNWNLWYQMKSKEPEFNFNAPSGWDTFFKGYDERLDYNNKVHKAIESNPQDVKQYELSPWTMLMDSSANKKKSP